MENQDHELVDGGIGKASSQTFRLKIFGYIFSDDRTFTAVGTAPNDEQAARAENMLRKCLAERGEDRLIEICDVDQDEYKRRRGVNAPKVIPMQVFDTAADASRYLGYGHNEVGIRYAAAKRKGLKEFTMVWITFRHFRGD